MNIIPNNFMAGTGQKVGCDWGMSLRINYLKFKTSRKLSIVLRVYGTHFDSKTTIDYSIARGLLFEENFTS